MDAPDTARQLLEQADSLAATAHRDTRWYARWLVLFGLLSLLTCALFAAFPGAPAVVLGMSVYGVGVAALVVWASRRGAATRYMTRLHLAVMAGFAVIWTATMVLGTRSDDPAVVFLTGGGLILLLTVAGAWVVTRRGGRRP
ncbi:hypothetical protein GC722_01600 [Auraticoccus sp. F435]|uniref:Uncharacterized protein n=1 Tax=Auraticoccus cholistanensis TaxID=2656650 RepID=A0A6A9USN6_9ACTN|nr:hypothetical protein [Auraticoccus cholistanensis]MVA74735.1 hypothetical protein [Auraticoccus cholistanensis]